MENAKININTDKETKMQAERLFGSLGINMTSAINMFLKRAILEKGIPFDVSLNAPNSLTLEAIREAEDIASHPDNYPSYKTLDELKAALDT